jgi:hypothetical protein
MYVDSGPKIIALSSGNFCDLETIVTLKQFATEISTSKLETTNLSYDFQEDYSINETFKNIHGFKVMFIVGINFRLINPIFNIKLRELSFRNNILIGYIGSYHNSTYQMYHLGNNLETLKKIFEGKH